MKIIENLKNKTSTGMDGISNQLLKSAKNVWVKPITTIINQIIVTGMFPHNLMTMTMTMTMKTILLNIKTVCSFYIIEL